MIRKHNLKRTIPKSIIKKVMDYNRKSLYQHSWEQVPGSYYPELQLAIFDAIGVTGDTHEIILHFFTGTIETHKDKMDKRCFIVPLKVTDSMSFHEEYNHVKFECGKYYSFNDFNAHGLSNEYGAYGLVASVSKDYNNYVRSYK